MTKCSGVKKQECKSPCEWISGKGCKSTEAAKPKATKPKATKPKATKPKTPSPKSPHGKVFAFLGFKDDDLIKTLQEHGNKVFYAIKPDTTHIVYKQDKRIQAKLDASELPKKLLKDFVEKYNFASKKVKKSEDKKESAKPAPKPVPKPEPAPKPAPKPKANLSLFTNYTKFPAKYHDPKGDYFDDDEDTQYKNYSLSKIFKHAKGALNGMFTDVKENNVRYVMANLFYVPSKDLFIMPIMAKAESDPKDKSLNDVYGVEFTYDPKVKYMIKVDKNVMILISDYKYNKQPKLADITDAIVNEYDDAIQVMYSS